jgi:heparan-alpha-glucosaminide N-acetyltransferase
MPSAQPHESERLISLDAFRGFVMLAMVSDDFGLPRVAEKFPDSPLWQWIGYQFSHVQYTGCAAWDLIQPSFMFIVGVAMPYSYAKRLERGDSKASVARHVLFRAIFLTLLGVFLRSNGREQTNFTFEDVVSQLGLGYAFVYLTLGRGMKAQLGAALAILAGYWAWFFFTPLPNPIPDGIPPDWQQFPFVGPGKSPPSDVYPFYSEFWANIAQQWNKHVNPAGMSERWLLNQFPRPEPFQFNGGGYQTLNFVPSMATTIFGVMTGEYLRSADSVGRKALTLLATGAICLVLGMALDGTIWPGGGMQWTFCPIVKKIWTPTWAIFSTGWVLWSLAAFLWIVDGWGFKRLVFPFVVVGLNPLTMYIMHWLIDGWVNRTLWTHSRTVAQWLGYNLNEIVATGEAAPAGDGGWVTYLPIIERVAVTFVLWLFCLWLYRRKIFVRV